MELTDFQRVLLANSYRQLELIEDDSSTKQLYHNISNSLKEGYSEIYNNLLVDSGFVEGSELLPSEQQQEVLEDFEMYQFLINHNKESDIPFIGYDGNASKKYGFALFILEDLHAYPDIKKLFGDKINSHGEESFTNKKHNMISKYRELKLSGKLYHDNEAANMILEAQYKRICNLNLQITEMLVKVKSLTKLIYKRKGAYQACKQDKRRCKEWWFIQSTLSFNM